MQSSTYSDISAHEALKRPHGGLALFAALTGLAVGFLAGCGWQTRAGNCGDGTPDREEDEECDEGLSNKPEETAQPGDCTRSCIRIPLCGNSKIESNEPCDEGPDGGKWCTAECNVIPGCGNQVDESSEECDWGDGINLAPGDAARDECTTSCLLAKCGDNVVNHDEQCDGGNGCEADCTFTPAICGNSILEPEEGCDDGKDGDNDDDCTDKCAAPVCGDEFVQASLDEECDNGSDNGANKECKSDCQLNFCGDGDQGPGEACDDGDNGPGKLCNALCQPNVCGDDDKSPVEECDDGPANGAGLACKADCTMNVCGDGDQGPGEECDDGDLDEHDSCSNDCWKPRWAFLANPGKPNANLGGISGANEICASAAMDAGRPGTYNAWLSGSLPDSAPLARFNSTDFKGWYLLPTDPPTPIAHGWEGLTTENLIAAINSDAKGMKVDDTNAWTNTKQDGTRNSANNHCQNWGGSTGNSTRGAVSATALDVKWTVADENSSCTLGLFLYCFQVLP